jgi:putative transposase
VAQRIAVRAMQASFGLSERRACGLVGVDRSTCRYRGRRADWPALRERLRGLAAERRRFGYRRLHVLLRREGYRVNLKRVYRLYREEELAVRRRRRRRRVARGTPLAVPARINQRWSLDFLLDTLEDGRRVRLLAVVDDFTRACLAIEVDTSIGGRRVVEVLQRLVETRGTPAVLITDNRPEFIGRALDAWVYAPRHSAALHRPGQAESECLRREFQWPVPRRVLERALVPQPGSRAPDRRGLARGLQCRPAPQFPRQRVSHGVRAAHS